MSADTTYPPSTAYEALLRFYPDHRLHTVVRVEFTAKEVKMHCDCGGEPLVVTEGRAKTQKLKLKEVREALRNVPQGR